MNERSLWDAGNSFLRRDFLQGAASLALAGMVGRRAWSQSASSDTWKPPQVDKRLVVHTKAPFNAEPAPGDLIGEWITPVELFYVRSHAAQNPDIDPTTFRLTVEGMVDRPLELSIDDLLEMPQREVVATLTCAGNRRADFAAIKKAAGVQWKEGAIGNARWSGARLTDVLKQAGVQQGARHIWFESVDAIEDENGGTFAFGGSIPIEKAMADRDGTPGAVVTLRMNGAPLPADHGFPVRMVVPGYIGARSVKWLGRIVVSDRPSPNHYLAGAYRLVTEDTPLAWIEAGPIYPYRLNAAICEPAAASSLRAGNVTVRGYALPPGNGDTISAVDLSADGGKSWHAGKVTGKNVPYCWVLWEASVPVMKATSELIVRATDSAGLAQPQVVPWNMKGYLNNAWHHLPVKVTG